MEFKVVRKFLIYSLFVLIFSFLFFNSGTKTSAQGGNKEVDDCDLSDGFSPQTDFNEGDCALLRLEIKGAGVTETEKGKTKTVLVMDRSGSMSWGWDGQFDNTPPWRIGSAKIALNDFVDISDSAYDTIGLVSYSVSATQSMPLTTNYPDLRTKINALVATGGTSIGSGLKLANQMLPIEGEIPVNFIEAAGNKRALSLKGDIWQVDGTGHYYQEFPSPLAIGESPVAAQTAPMGGGVWGNNDVLFLLTLNGALYKHTSAGWETIIGGGTLNGAVKLAVSPSLIYALTYWGGIYIADGGSWQLLETVPLDGEASVMGISITVDSWDGSNWLGLMYFATLGGDIYNYYSWPGGSKGWDHYVANPTMTDLVGFPQFNCIGCGYGVDKGGSIWIYKIDGGTMKVNWSQKESVPGPALDAEMEPIVGGGRYIYVLDVSGNLWRLRNDDLINGTLTGKIKLNTDLPPPQSVVVIDPPLRYIVLASDGQQNTYPSIYDESILTTTVNLGIKTYTIGISNAIRTQENMGSFNPNRICCDYNNNGIKDGEDYLMEIANKTDGKYFFAASEEDLKQIYEDIGDEIHQDYRTVVTDYINNPFTTFFNGNTTDICISESADGSGLSCDSDGDGRIALSGGEARVSIVGDKLAIDIDPEAIPEGKTLWAFIRIKMGQEGDDVPIDNPSVDPCGNKIEYFDSTGNLVGSLTDCLENISVDIIGLPPVPSSADWFKTEGGDVHSNGSIIDSIHGVNFLSSYIASVGDTTNLCWGTGDPYTYPCVNERASVRGWQIIAPDPYGQVKYIGEDSFYDWFNNKLPDDIDELTIEVEHFTPAGPGQVINPVLTSDKVVIWFVNGDAMIQDDLELDSANQQSGFVLVVSGNLEISANVKRVDGLLFVDGTLTTVSNGTDSDDRLVINGAVYGSDSSELSFERSSKVLTKDQEAEKISFDPRYLLLLRDPVGKSSFTWQEVAP